MGSTPGRVNDARGLHAGMLHMQLRTFLGINLQPHDAPSLSIDRTRACAAVGRTLSSAQATQQHLLLVQPHEALKAAVIVQCKVGSAAAPLLHAGCPSLEKSKGAKLQVARCCQLPAAACAAERWLMPITRGSTHSTSDEPARGMCFAHSYQHASDFLLLLPTLPLDESTPSTGNMQMVYLQWYTS